MALALTMNYSRQQCTVEAGASLKVDVATSAIFTTLNTRQSHTPHINIMHKANLAQDSQSLLTDVQMEVFIVQNLRGSRMDASNLQNPQITQRMRITALSSA